MEARFNCCKAIQKALMSSSKVASDPSLAGIISKVNLIEHSTYFVGERRGPDYTTGHAAYMAGLKVFMKSFNFFICI